MVKTAKYIILKSCKKCTGAYVDILGKPLKKGLVHEFPVGYPTLKKYAKMKVLKRIKEADTDAS